jgi:hypothetical protein
MYIWYNLPYLIVVLREMGRIDIAITRNPYQSDHIDHEEKQFQKSNTPYKKLIYIVLCCVLIDKWLETRFVRIYKPTVQIKGMWRDGILASKTSLK